MKYLKTLPLILAAAWMTSCAPTTPVGNVEGLERQAPVTPDSNSIGDAINARNAVDYSNSRGNRSGYGYGRGYYGY